MSRSKKKQLKRKKNRKRLRLRLSRKRLRKRLRRVFPGALSQPLRPSVTCSRTKMLMPKMIKPSRILFAKSLRKRREFRGLPKPLEGKCEKSNGKRHQPFHFVLRPPPFPPLYLRFQIVLLRI